VGLRHQGKVYNMTVTGDNSYTVEGHVVHNCYCSWEEVMMPPTDFARQVGGWVRGDNDFLDDYASWLGVRSFAPIPVTLDLIGVMDLWLDNDVDAMAQVMRL
jgi:hypothetical protein